MNSHLSGREAAEYCGVSEKTIRNWLAAGRLMAEKVGRSYRIPREQLEPLRRVSPDYPRTSNSLTIELPSPEVAQNGDDGELSPTLPPSELVALLREAQAEARNRAAEAATYRMQVEQLTKELQALRRFFASRDQDGVPHLARRLPSRGRTTREARRPRNRRGS
jgi:excisionase family DNA binding protein